VKKANKQLGDSAVVLSRTQFVVYVLASILVADFVLFGYLPSKRRLTALDGLRQEQLSAVSQVVDESSELAAMRANINQYQRELRAYPMQIPAHRALGEFLHTVSSLMQQHALQDRYIEPALDIHGDHIPCIPVTLRCRGSFAQLHAFYHDLQELPRLIRFDEVLFERDSKANGEVQMQASIAIFYQPEADLSRASLEDTVVS
jgi:Tfp pilus assembly protein PilO